MTFQIHPNNEPGNLLDHDVTLRCPHCGVLAGMTAISIPRYELLHRFKLQDTGIVFRCDSCSRPVYLQFKVASLSNPITLSEEFNQIQSALEPFEHKYLSAEVGADFQEALTCYAYACWNAFASMCRRCLQSVAVNLGVNGSSKVEAQIRELKEMGVVDDETFEQLRQIMLSGHDGAHPHLPALSADRAAVLLQLMKDVLYQLYVRPGKVKEAAALRAAQNAARSGGAAFQGTAPSVGAEATRKLCAVPSGCTAAKRRKKPSKELLAEREV